jgi:hypothetical protein
VDFSAKSSGVVKMYFFPDKPSIHGWETFLRSTSLKKERKDSALY